MSGRRPILLLDFDGVICDSTEECAVAAWNAWLAHRGRDGFVRDAAEVPEPYLGTLRRLRKFVRTAGEYYVPLTAAESGREVEGRREFDRLSRRDRRQVSAFAERVFAARARLRREDEAHWIDLHRLYPGIAAQVRRVWPQLEPFLVTGKDRETVTVFFRRFGVELPGERIYDRDAGHDKLGVARRIAGRLGRGLAEMTALDDNVHHLLPLKRAGCRVLMAEWGYHTEEDLRLAEEQGVRRVGLEDWPAALLSESR
jgi:phosphoglycolate phosphatase-like HAD superfamily hydrolase